MTARCHQYGELYIGTASGARGSAENGMESKEPGDGA